MANLALIREAMAKTPPQMIGFQYTKKENAVTENYICEPYEIREEDGVFFGFKTNDISPGIRKFFLNRMRAEQLLPQTFTPRWPLKPGIEGVDEEA